ncbi:hypothetical protein [Niallia endozanthoxylica]|uniref:Uncharacterized protein n=1 Tax=Niallia endozanthoxylica TaxID=2036016 RepID=A0A5J5HQM7_9BACI|nr:hypothetical protein [Niallia endozanthoxylica]KAA9023555.1 hypothetical protein F4V44_12875 [Niallia endozanthoxylica]
MELDLFKCDFDTIELTKEKVLDLLTVEYGYMIYLMYQEYVNEHDQARNKARVEAFSEIYSLLSGVDTETEDAVVALAREAVHRNYIKGFKSYEKVMEGLELEFVKGKSKSKLKDIFSSFQQNE